MDFVASVRVLLRRWYVVAPLVLLTLGACALAWLRVAPTYVLTASVLLRNPSIQADPDSGARNPYVDFGNLAIPARVISDVMMQERVRAELSARGATTEYEVAPDSSSVVPLLIVEVKAASETMAVQTGELVVDRIGEELESRQRALGAPPMTFITPEVITPPVKAEPTYASRLRAVAGLLGVGALLSVAAAFLVEAVMSARYAPQRQGLGEPAVRTATRRPSQMKAHLRRSS